MGREEVLEYEWWWKGWHGSTHKHTHIKTHTHTTHTHLVSSHHFTQHIRPSTTFHLQQLRRYVNNPRQECYNMASWGFGVIATPLHTRFLSFAATHQRVRSFERFFLLTCHPVSLRAIPRALLLASPHCRREAGQCGSAQLVHKVHPVSPARKTIIL